jgi:hypothetical protein
MACPAADLCHDPHLVSDRSVEGLLPRPACDRAANAHREQYLSSGDCPHKRCLGTEQRPLLEFTAALSARGVPSSGGFRLRRRGHAG